MDKIGIYSNNKISKLIEKAFSEKGYDIVLLKSLNSTKISKDYKAIIDTTNVLNKTNKDDEDNLIHNTSEVVSLIDLSKKSECPFLFLYRESADLKPEASLFTALELIDKYGSQKNITAIKVVVEDIYGPSINTSEKLQNFIDNLISGDPLTVDNDYNDHYLLHEDDFNDGLEEIVNYTQKERKYKVFTLFPEEPIIEIELAHFINSLSELPQDIEYSKDDSTPSQEINIEVNYPSKWYPKQLLEEGLIDTLRSYDIPIPEDALLELEQEKEKYFDDFYKTKTEPIEEEVDDEPSTLEELADDSIKIAATRKVVKAEKSSLDFDKAYNDEYTDDLDINDVSKTDKLNISYDTYSDLQNQTPKQSVQDNYGYDENSYLYGNDPLSGSDSSYGKSNSYWLIALLAFALIAILMIPSGIYIKNLSKGLTNLNKAANAAQEFEFSESQKHSETATEYFSKLSENRIPLPIKIAGRINGTSNEDISEIVSTYETASTALNYISLIGLDTGISSETSELGSVLGISNASNTTNYLDKTLESIEKIENSKSQISTDNNYLKTQLLKITDPLIDNKEELLKIKTISPVLNTMLGKEATQTYLLVNQDSLETRGSGGVIELYGILKIENGKLYLEEITDSKVIDNQIIINEVKVEPSKIISDVFRTESLLFSDSSWDPNFPSAAWDIKTLYEESTLETIDGVISINNDFLKDLVAIFGEVNISNPKETITSDNFDDLVDSYSKDPRNSYIEYLISLNEEILNNAIESENKNDIAKIVYESLNSKNIILYHSDNSALGAIMQNNWGGSMLNSYDDYLFVVDSNISSNKVNHNITRKISYEGTNPNEGNYVRRVIVTYVNNNEDMPVNRFVNHLKLYTPNDAGLNSAFMITNSEKKLITKNVDITSDGSKVFYSTEFILEPQQHISLLFEFETPIKNYDGSINLVLQKQPGRSDDELDIMFNYPLGNLKNDAIEENAKVEDGSLIYKTNTLYDRSFKFPL